MRYTTSFPDGGGINLTKWMCARKVEKITPPPEWTRHTAYHWSQTIKGKRLDFWPSKDKWMYEGKIYFGDVDKFINQLQSTDA